MEKTEIVMIDCKDLLVWLGDRHLLADRYQSRLKTMEELLQGIVKNVGKN
jgi:hypothetical protein